MDVPGGLYAKKLQMHRERSSQCSSRTEEMMLNLAVREKENFIGRYRAELQAKETKGEPSEQKTS